MYCYIDTSQNFHFDNSNNSCFNAFPVQLQISMNSRFGNTCLVMS